MMDFRILTFLELCRQRNYTKTAKTLSVTQPAVTQHIQYLEQYFGVKLFYYEGKKLLLTVEGAFLQKAFLSMLADSKKIKERITNLIKQKKVIRLGATLTIGEFVVPPMIGRYLENNPETELSLLVNNTSMLLNLLKNAKIDCAFIEGYFDKQEFDYKLLMEDDFIPVCGYNYSFSREPLQLTDLFTEKLIIREFGSGTREVLERVLHERSYSVDNFQNNICIGNLNVIKYLCEKNIGITFLYRSAARKELEDDRLKEIKLRNFNVTHEYNFVTLKNSVFKNDYETLFEEIKG